MKEKLYLAFSILMIAGCAATSNKNDPNLFSHVSEGIKERTDYNLRQTSQSAHFEIPEWVTLDDGLSQDEAIALALWNNAQLQADLATLGFARADLLEAKMISNPAFSLLFPIGPKALETDLGIPIDILWQRPHHIAMANLDAQSLAESLITNGLDLIRNVQITYVNLWLYQKKLELAKEDVQLKNEIGRITQARLKTGDISSVAADIAFVDSLESTSNMNSLLKETDITNQQLNTLLGLSRKDITYNIGAINIPGKPTVSIDTLFQTALAARPDLRAAELEIEAKGKKIGWEKSKIYNFIAIIDAKDEGEDFLTIGPGIQLDIPIFNQNQSQIAYAEAEFEQAARKYEALRQNIILQVHQAFTRYLSDYEEYKLWKNDIIPSLQKKVEQETKSFKIGEMSYLMIVESMQKLIDSKVHLVESIGNLLIDTAELNYWVGKKLI
jgi:cobalt-zinc-cadmium efflux system outer membrane protein